MKTCYKIQNQRNNVMSMLKELMLLYRDNKHIEDYVNVVIFYNNGLRLKYPENAEEIKLKNISNIIYDDGDNYSMDFTHDFIGTQEDYNNYINYCIIHLKTFSREEIEPKNKLIVDDIDDYYKSQERKYVR